VAETLTIRVVLSVRTLDKEERSVCSPSEIAQLYATLQHCVVAGSEHWSGIQFRRGLRPDLIHHVGYGLRSTYLPRIPVNKGWGCASIWSPKVSSANFAVTEFSDGRRFVATLTCFVPWRTYTPLAQEYAALVTWPVDAA
jgi:hypothetical protein